MTDLHARRRQSETVKHKGDKSWQDNPKLRFIVVLALVVVGLVAFAVYRADIFAPEGQDRKRGQDRSGKIDPDGQLRRKKAESPDTPPPRHHGQGIHLQAGRAAAGDQGHVGLQADGEQHRALRPERLGRLGTDHPGQRRLQARQGLEDARRQGVPRRTGADRRPGRDDRAPTPPARSTSAGARSTWCRCSSTAWSISTGKPKDSRIMPRIYQQIDWSNGGDGIVVREDIKTVADLRDKKLVLAQNSPSQYFALNMLVAGGVQPSEVNMIYTNTAFEAAAAFDADKTIAGAVSWSPDIYNLAKAKGNRMLVTTQTANKLIADVWFARADFAKDHPGIIEGLVRGIFDAMEELKKPDKKDACSKLMAAGYNIPADDALNMFNDAHNTNWAENYQFFLNQNNPTNFEQIWRQSYYLYRQIGTIQNPAVRFDQVMDFSVIQKLGNEEKYKSQKDEYQIQLAPKTVGEIRAESAEILTNTVVIHFYPQRLGSAQEDHRKVDGKTSRSFTIPNVDNVLEGIAKLVGQFGAARVDHRRPHRQLDARPGAGRRW